MSIQLKNALVLIKKSFIIKVSMDIQELIAELNNFKARLRHVGEFL